MIGEKGNMEKLKFVDSLRGYAILLVILNHTAQSISGLPAWLYNISYFGKYGVQLFFVMSAYTLCLSWSNRKQESNQTFKYFIRRYFRIAPLYYFGIVFYGILFLLRQNGYIHTFLLNTDYSFVKVLANVTFTHSLSPATVHSVVPGGWSIGTEMVFYILFPGLFYCLSKLGSKKALIVLVPFAVMAVVFVFFRALPKLFPPLSRHDFEFYYCSVLNQLPVFLIGMAIHFYPGNFNLSKGNSILSFCMFLAIVAVTIFLHGKGKGDITITTFSVGLAFFFLFMAVKNLKVLNSSLIQWIGRLSFSIYLFHFVFALWLSSFLNQVLMPALNSYCIFAICLFCTVACSVVVASITKVLIEDKGIKFGSSIIKKKV